MGEAQKLQRTLSDGVLHIVSIGNREYPPEDPPPGEVGSLQQSLF